MPSGVGGGLGVGSWLGVGSGVGPGVSVGTGVGSWVGVGSGVGSSEGAGVGVGSGLGVGVGSAVGEGVGVAAACWKDRGVNQNAISNIRIIPTVFSDGAGNSVRFSCDVLRLCSNHNALRCFYRDRRNCLSGQQHLRRRLRRQCGAGSGRIAVPEIWAGLI